MLPNEIQISVEFGVGVVQDIVTAAYDFLKKETQRRDPFGKETKKYVSGMIERFGEVKVLGMNKPVPLLSLYVRANILEKISVRAGAKLEDLEQFFEHDKRAFGKKSETHDGEEIANRLQKFIVLGKPGAGKTTFLRYLALAMLNQQSLIEKRRLPIFVTLRDWADRQISLSEYIANQFDICGFEQAGLFVERLLQQGNCLVLFDGLDEVSQEIRLDDILRELRDFTDKYSDNQFVMSCRIAAYNHWFERFTDVEMADFNDAQIETFVKNWFSGEPKTAKECLERLKGSAQLKELATVPLLLTLLCITYGEINDFPANRAELYREAIDALLRKWDSSRRIRRDDPYKQLSLKRKEDMFARIAFGTFTENKYFIRERDLTKMIENFIANLPGFEADKLEVDSRLVLQSIEAHHGIFVERAKGIYSFAHLTFQEYFTAKYIVDNASNGSLEKLVAEHLYDHKWEEVFLLVAGMLADADELLLLMLKKNNTLKKDPDVKIMLKLVEEALLPTEKSSKLIQGRACALFYLNKMEEGKPVSREEALEHRAKDPRSDKEYRDQFYAEAWLEDVSSKLMIATFDLFKNEPDDLLPVNLELLEEEKYSYVDYEPYFKIPLKFIDTLLLLIGCLNADAYLSNNTREYILENMLAPLEVGGK